MTIETMRAHHCPQVAGWAAASGLSGWAEHSLKASLSRPACLGLIEPGKAGIIGTLAGDDAAIDLVIVAPDQRRRGFGRALCEAFARTVAASGAQSVCLEVARSNSAARGLYRALGYETVGRRAAYYRDGDDALILRRGLAPK